MNYQIQGLSIHAEVHGTAEPALVFLHLWIPQIPSVTNAIEISDMRKGTGGWVKKATGK